jgi:hypothetical protein
LISEVGVHPFNAALIGVKATTFSKCDVATR